MMEADVAMRHRCRIGTKESMALEWQCSSAFDAEIYVFGP
jgi:hypothetical protein